MEKFRCVTTIGSRLGASCIALSARKLAQLQQQQKLGLVMITQHVGRFMDEGDQNLTKNMVETCAPKP